MYIQPVSQPNLPGRPGQILWENGLELYFEAI